MGLGTRLDLSMSPGCEQGLHVGTSCAGCWKQELIGLAKVRYIIMNTGEICTAV